MSSSHSESFPHHTYTRLKHIQALVLEYNNKKKSLGTDSELRTRYTNREVEEQFYHNNPFDVVPPLSPPPLLRTFRRTNTNEEHCDLLEARSNLKLEFLKKLIPLTTFDVIDLKYIIDNNPEYLVYDLDFPDKKDSWVTLYTSVNNEKYELLYDGVFYVAYYRNDDRMDLSKRTKDEKVVLNSVYLDLDKVV